MFTLTRLALATAAALLVACGPAPKPRPKVKPYTPSFSYTAAQAAGPLDVTVGVVGAEFTGDGETWWRQNRDDEVARRMVASLRASFTELLSRKGFRVAGPYDSLANMTFPEKKGSDLVLFATLDITASAQASDQNTDASRNFLTGQVTTTQTCKIAYALQGDISLIVKEPLSGEKMWVKRLEVMQKTQPVQVTGNACLGAGVPDGVEVKNAWARMHEATYKQVMGALDRYVSGEEFQVLQRQAQELRAKKAY
ncbi:MAG: hypothetical protein KC613_05025 [Myxococcales bacterium]|nr:hypothetical protein [Myxococcales bacterium]MCB9526246.1 hypothetical protein [Myxococcales bacterium]